MKSWTVVRAASPWHAGEGAGARFRARGTCMVLMLMLVLLGRRTLFAQVRMLGSEGIVGAPGVEKVFEWAKVRFDFGYFVCVIRRRYACHLFGRTEEMDG
jgi:hypothetical protein